MSLPDLGYTPTAAHLRDKSRERIAELEAKVASQRHESMNSGDQKMFESEQKTHALEGRVRALEARAGDLEARANAHDALVKRMADELGALKEAK